MTRFEGYSARQKALWERERAAEENGLMAWLVIVKADDPVQVERKRVVSCYERARLLDELRYVMEAGKRAEVSVHSVRREMGRRGYAPKAPIIFNAVGRWRNDGW